MATINVKLRNDKNPNQHGEYPLMIRLYYKRTMYPFTFGFKVHPKFWNKDTQQIKPTKFYSDYGRLNHIINKKKDRAKKLLKNWVHDDGVNDEVMREIISSDLKGIKRDPSVDIISFCDDVAEQYEREGKQKSANNYKNLQSKLKEFTEGDYLAYEDIDSYFIEDFFDWLKHEKENRMTGEKGLAHNTALRSVQYLKATYEKAQKRHRNIPKDDPFFYFDESPEKTKKEYLNEDEFEKFKELSPDTKNGQIVKDMFILAVYACGMRFSDVFRLRWDQIDFVENKVEFVAYKTRNTKKGKFINPIGDEGMKILKKYREKNGDEKYVFDWMMETNLPIETGDGLHRFKQSCSVKTYNAFKKDLCEKLGKHVNFHMSRHTFSNMVRRSGMSVSDVNQIFDHSNIKTTEIYLDGLINTDNTGKNDKIKQAITGW